MLCKLITLIRIKLTFNDLEFTNKTSIERMIIGVIKNEGLVLTTLSEPIVIEEIKIEGKKTSKGNQLIQQLKAKIGEQFI